MRRLLLLLPLLAGCCDREPPAKHVLVTVTRTVDPDDAEYREGQRAYAAGVPATADPYAHGNYYRSSKAWLNGWVAAQEEAMKKKAERK